jgi:hypothetical protein
MSRHYIKDAYWIINKDGHQQVYDSNGKLVPFRTVVRVTDEVGSYPKAMIQVLVNLAGTEEEMHEKIKELNK